jgi:hypothetical protein
VERRSPTRLDGNSAGNEPGRRPALQLRQQRDYWDPFMRDEAQERIAVHHIESNPVQAELCAPPEAWCFTVHINCFIDHTWLFCRTSALRKMPA